MVKSTRKNNRQSKNQVTNVRVIDKDEGTDDLVVQRHLNQYIQSEGQIRVVCNFRYEFVPSGTLSGIVSFAECISTDDFVSFAAQYKEVRIKGIRFDIYDVQPSSTPTINFWSTFHQVGGNVPIGVENVVDRPDSRSVPPGSGVCSLAWLAHGQPEMEFQDTTTYANLGGISYWIQPSTVYNTTKYQLIAKFIVDFRGRL